MNLLNLLVARVARSSRSAAVILQQSEPVRTLNWREVGSDIARVAKLLAEEGVCIGDRVWLTGPHCYDLWVLDLALQSAGAVVVPIYPKTSASDLDAIARHTAPRYAVLLDSSWGSDWRARGRAGICQFWNGSEILAVARSRRPDWKHWTAQTRAGAAKTDLSAILHTSGTAGIPRAVSLSSKGILFQLKALHKRLRLSAADISLSCLPTAHIMGRLETYLPIETGGAIAFSSEGMQALQDIARVQPTFFVGVPRFYDVLKEQIEASKDMRKILGEQFRFGVCGGAPLSLETGLFFARNEISVVEGYGLTEAGGAVAIGDPRRPVVGSVGEVLPGMQARVDSNGEIWIRGKTVLEGYWGERAAESKASFRQGWFRTGDVGSWGSEKHAKHLCVRDRVKDLIVTSNGKKVSPQKLEAMLSSVPGIRQVIVLGEGEKFLTALFFAEKDVTSETISPVVARMNEKLAPHERIRDFRVIAGVQAHGDSELTPTLKIRRQACMKNYREVIREMYRDGSDRTPT